MSSPQSDPTGNSHITESSSQSDIEAGFKPAPTNDARQETGVGTAGTTRALRRRALIEPFLVFLVTFTVLAMAAPRITTYLSPLTGDEPFYIMTAISIWNDQDITECHNC